MHPNAIWDMQPRLHSDIECTRMQSKTCNPDCIRIWNASECIESEACNPDCIRMYSIPECNLNASTQIPFRCILHPNAIWMHAKTACTQAFGFTLYCVRMQFECMILDCIRCAYSTSTVKQTVLMYCICFETNAPRLAQELQTNSLNMPKDVPKESSSRKKTERTEVD